MARGGVTGKERGRLQPLDLVPVNFETLILMEIKSCVRFSGYTMVDALSGSDSFGWTEHNFVW